MIASCFVYVDMTGLLGSLLCVTTQNWFLLNFATNYVKYTQLIIQTVMYMYIYFVFLKKYIKLFINNSFTFTVNPIKIAGKESLEVFYTAIVNNLPYNIATWTVCRFVNCYILLCRVELRMWQLEEKCHPAKCPGALWRLSSSLTATLSTLTV